MNSARCIQCGLINFASAIQCKRCGAELARRAVPAQAPADDRTIHLVAADGLPGGVKAALLFITACVVCALTISWVKPLLPEGRYLVIFFLPFAFAGYLAGLVVTNLTNAVYKSLIPARPR